MELIRSSVVKKSLEAIVLPLIVLAVMRLWPGSHIHYPWWWLAPLAIALRYGMAYGLGSGLVLVLGNMLGEWVLGATWIFSSSGIVGGFIATYLAGLYASHWGQRLAEDNARLDYLEQRLESLTRVFYVTRLSHSRLEESLITKSNDLRSALEAISEQIGSENLTMSNDALPSEPLRDLLQLLAFYGRIGSACVFGMEGGRIGSQAIAALGPEFVLEHGDPLITKVIEGEQPAYYSVNQILSEQPSLYRAVFPLIAADGSMLGLIVVLDMPLLAVDEENLLTMAAMVAFVADVLRAEQISRAVRQVVPDCPSDFALDWSRLGHLKRRVGVGSSWVLLHAGSDAPTSVVDSIHKVRRGLDRYWIPSVDSAAAPRLLILLPLAGRGAVEGFVQRIDAICMENLGDTLQGLGWRVETGQLQQGSGEELAKAMACGDSHAVA